MQQRILKHFAVLVLMLGMVLAGSIALTRSASAAPDAPVGAVYTLTNATAGNSVVVFNRTANGSLRSAGQFFTGGNGTGAGLGSQGAIALREKQKQLFVVNAASNSISVFAIKPPGLQWTSTVDSGGTKPISLTVHKKTLFVLNADSGNIVGFRIKKHGRLVANGSVQPLSGAGIAPAQISFNPDGSRLVVTEKNTDKIDIYAVDANGQASAPNPQNSSGPTPFGFAFNQRGVFMVTEAHGGAASSVSSYKIGTGGNLITVTPSVNIPDQKAACWMVATQDGRFAYAANTGTGTITGFRVSRSGNLTLLNANGVTGITGGAAADLAISNDNKYLYVLNGALHTIDAFAIQSDGSLAKLASADGLPVGIAGLAAR